LSITFYCLPVSSCLYPTQWSRVHFEKLIVAQLIKQFPAIYGTRMFVTVLTGTYPEPDESSLHPPTHVFGSILILSSHIRLGLPSGLYPSSFSTKIFMHFSSLPYVLHTPPTLHVCMTLILFGEDYELWTSN
jgi:hypothetical protein